jgi:hypothetical protein
MADIASELANKSGVSVESAQKGLGAVLDHLESKLPADSFAKVSAAVPGADRRRPSATDTGAKAPGGVIGAVEGAIGKVLGGSGAEALHSKLSQFGLTPDQIQGFIPKVMEHLKDKLPPSVMEQISRHLPTPQEAAH